MTRVTVIALVALALTGASPAAVRAARPNIYADHPLVSRYPGQVPMVHPPIWHDNQESTLVLGKVQGDDRAEGKQIIRGRTYQAVYANPAQRSVAEIFEVYEKGLRGRGFHVLFSCRDAACGARGNFDTEGLQFRSAAGYLRRFIAARLPGRSGDAYVQVLVQAWHGSDGDTQLTIVEANPM
jgi:hypothetical protein